MRPIAGKMRPKTSESGIFNTNRNRPVSTSMLTRILVPKPKKAFQSPGAHKIGRKPAVDVVVVIARSSIMAGICKIPSDCGTIHASGMPIMTPRRRGAEGGDESGENTVDSKRSVTAWRFHWMGFAPIDRPVAADGGQFT